MKTRFTFDDYKNALNGVGPKLKENILDRASRDPGIDILQLKALWDFAFPEVAL